MIKKNFVVIVAGLIIVGVTTNGQATMVVDNINPNVVYDTISDSYWIRDLNLFKNKTYPEMEEVIDDLNSNPDFKDQRWMDWHIDNDKTWSFFSEYINGRENEIGEVFYPTETRDDPDFHRIHTYWGGVSILEELNSEYPYPWEPGASHIAEINNIFKTLNYETGQAWWDWGGYPTVVNLGNSSPGYPPATSEA